MSRDYATLAPFYKGWDRYQRLLTEAVGSLTDEHLRLGVSPALRPVWLLAAHVIAARVHWFHHVMGEGSAELAPLRAWDDDGQPRRSAAELVDGLNASWQMIQDCLDRWTPAMLDDTFTTPRGYQRSRQWIVWHVLEHDLHHGGELFYTLGMHGLPTPNL